MVGARIEKFWLRIQSSSIDEIETATQTNYHKKHLYAYMFMKIAKVRLVAHFELDKPKRNQN